MTIDSSAAGAALLDDVLVQARKDRVLLKRGDRPVALVISVEGKDEEQIELENDTAFWRMIERRRREPTVPFERVKAKLLVDEARASRRSRPKATKGQKRPARR
jgi:hypothetical protein